MATVYVNLLVNENLLFVLSIGVRVYEPGPKPNSLIRLLQEPYEGVGFRPRFVHPHTDR